MDGNDDAAKIAKLEQLLARVKENAQAPRTSANVLTATTSPAVEISNIPTGDLEPESGGPLVSRLDINIADELSWSDPATLDQPGKFADVMVPAEGARESDVNATSKYEAVTGSTPPPSVKPMVEEGTFDATLSEMNVLSQAVEQGAAPLVSQPPAPPAPISAPPPSSMTPPLRQAPQHSAPPSSHKPALPASSVPAPPQQKGSALPLLVLGVLGALAVGIYVFKQETPAEPTVTPPAPTVAVAQKPALPPVTQLDPTPQPSAISSAIQAAASSSAAVATSASPIPAASASAATSAAATEAPAASATPPLPEKAPELAAPPAPVGVEALDAKKALLTVTSNVDASVYVLGKLYGSTGAQFEVPCGQKFVRLAKRLDPPRPILSPSDWLEPGRSVRIPCRQATTVTISVP